MKINDMRRRNIGLNFWNSVAEIVVWAPNAKRVTVTSDSKELDLISEEFGYWRLSTEDLKPGDGYQIGLDGKKVPDIASLHQPDIHGKSYAVDLNSFTWNDQEWQNPSIKDYIIYELHTGTFSPDGNFQGIEEKLEHLIQLGVNAIELMPLAQFPGERNWGYDGVYPFAVQHSYGGAAGLQKLIDLCHQKGLAVIIDVVYNHLGPEGNYFNEFGPYFTSKYHTPWGNAINFDDAQCDPVRNYFMENALMWLRDFHADGLRLDAVHAIKDFSPKHFLQELREHIDQLMEITGKKYYLIVECDLNDKRFIEPLNADGFGMHAQWTDEFHHALRVAAGGNKNGYYADFDGIGSLAEAFSRAYVYHGQYSRQRQKYFGTDPAESPGEQFIVFSQNHDQVGNRMLGERSSQLFSADMQKLMAAAVMISPYLPMLFMGEEWGASSPFQYFISHSDQDLIEAVREGRKAEFKDFQNQGHAPDPQAEQTFAACKLNWAEALEAPHRNMLNYYRALIQLRRQQPALKNPDRIHATVKVDERAEVLIIERTCAEQELIAILNFSKQKQTPALDINLPDFQLIFDSADPYWQEQAASPTFLRSIPMVEVAPESIIIYGKYDV